MNVIKIAIISLILLLVAGSAVYASDISDADFVATIETTNNGTANVSISSNISGLSTPYLISAGFLNSSANNCAMQTISGADIPFMPGYDTNPWIMYNGDLGSDTITMSKAYFKNITDGKICMFLDPYMTIEDDASMELSDNYTLSLNDVGLISSTDNIIAYKPNAYALTYSGNNVTYVVTGGGTLTSEVSVGEHDIDIIALPSETEVEYTLRPEAEGDETNIPGSTGANHYTEVDDVVSDESTTWVAASGMGAITYYRDLYEIPDITCVSVNTITIYARCKKDGIGWAKIGLKTGGTVYETSAITLTSSWTTYSQEWTTNPDTSLAWTPADINNLQIGISLAGGFAGVTVQSYCTQVYVIVDVDIAASGAQLLIDNIPVDTTAVDCTVPDTADNITIGSGCTSYIGEFSTSEDGVDTCVINWEYGTTFTDDSGNGNDATPLLRASTSDPDVTSRVISFLPVDEYIAPAFAVTGADFFNSDNITATANFTTGNATLDFPGKDIIDSIATAGDVPSQLIYTIISMFILVAMGLLTGYFLREQATSSMILTFVAIMVVMAVFVALHWWDWWMFLFWMIIVVATAHAGQHRREA